MTATLLLRFDGPMQSWSVAGFADRPTLPFPTKSGIIGLLANAHGRKRSESIDDLAALSTGVRADEKGCPLTDFQIAGHDGWRSADGKLHTDTRKIRRKGYLTDAVFTAALSGPTSVIESCACAVQRPARPLFLGRRCCPPAAPVLIGVSELTVIDALRTVPYQGHRPDPPTRFLAALDSNAGELWDDAPVSFASGHREHRPRPVTVIELEYAGPEFGLDAERAPEGAPR
jgi:CRISPR system Cascade subunit CasD